MLRVGTHAPNLCDRFKQLVAGSPEDGVACSPVAYQHLICWDDDSIPLEADYAALVQHQPSGRGEGEAQRRGAGCGRSRCHLCGHAVPMALGLKPSPAVAQPAFDRLSSVLDGAATSSVPSTRAGGQGGRRWSADSQHACNCAKFSRGVPSWVLHSRLRTHAAAQPCKVTASHFYSCAPLAGHTACQVPRLQGCAE